MPDFLPPALCTAVYSPLWKCAGVRSMSIPGIPRCFALAWMKAEEQIPRYPGHLLALSGHLIILGQIQCWLTRQAPLGCFVEDRLQCFSSLIILLQIFILWIKIPPGPHRAGEARKLPMCSQWKQEELPALEILLWLNSKQEICFTTTRESMWFWLLHSDQLKAEQEERKKTKWVKSLPASVASWGKRENFKMSETGD